VQQFLSLSIFSNKKCENKCIKAKRAVGGRKCGQGDLRIAMAVA
jgi:hypothetical protein